MENKPIITIDDFSKIEISIGHILSVEKIPDSEKLLKLSVDFGLKPSTDGSPDHSAQQNDLGERDIRQIVSGISKYFEDPLVLVGVRCAFATNLEPRMIMGLESQGMILAVSGEGFFSLLRTNDAVIPGSRVK
jgi:methionyl-tRNA synthetase